MSSQPEIIAVALIVGVGCLLAGSIGGFVLARFIASDSTNEEGYLEVDTDQLKLLDVKVAQAQEERDVARRELTRAHNAYRGAQSKIEELTAELQGKPKYEKVNHTVFLDGGSGSGKSTLIRRITNPWITVEQLHQTPASAVAQESGMQPVGFDAEGGQLHTVSFFDGVGEHPKHLMSAIIGYANSHGDEDAPTTTALLIWDLAKPLDANLEYFHRYRMEAVYLNDSVARHVRNFVVLFNKADRYGLSVQEQGELEARVLSDIFGGFPAETEIRFARGSVITGEGIHHAFGLVLQSLGLGDLQTTEF